VPAMRRASRLTSVPRQVSQKASCCDQPITHPTTAAGSTTDSSTSVRPSSPAATGIAGLTLGGGVVWLMPKYGLALDNLRAAEMVMADGRSVAQESHHHRELPRCGEPGPTNTRSFHITRSANRISGVTSLRPSGIQTPRVCGERMRNVASSGIAVRAFASRPAAVAPARCGAALRWKTFRATT
jgi:hypothetical protein